MAPKFWADAMLGDVARKLRILGYDTIYDPHIPGNMVLEGSRGTGRTIITRNIGLARRAAGVPTILVPGGREAMSRIVRDAGIDIVISGDSARCPTCNHPTLSVPAGDISAPPKVLERHHSFWKCAICGKTYWEGSHVTRLREEAKRWR